MPSYFELFFIFIILMLPFIYEKSYVFRYYFKYSIYYGVVSFYAIFLIPIFMLRPRNVKNLLLASAICRHVSTILGFKWEIRGKENLSEEQACIIVANHQSSLDVLGMFDLWPIMNKCTVVAKRELFYVWPFGLAAWLCGLIFIDRIHGDKARNTLNVANHEVKAQKIKLWVYPEGTRRNTCEIHSFKKGAFHMAVDAQIPILPVVFSSYITFLDDKRRIFNSGDVIITTLPKISTKGLTKEDLPKLMDEVHKQMSDAYKVTSEEVYVRSKAKNIEILTAAVEAMKRRQSGVGDACKDEVLKNIDEIDDIRKQQRTFNDSGAITKCAPI